MEDLKPAYEARDPQGHLPGALKRRDWSRFHQTIRYVPKDARSLLDCGCGLGHWLAFALKHRTLENHLGVDISEARIKEALALYPHLHLQAGYLEKLDLPQFDVVTCLEVLEHIPQWRETLDNLCRWARRRVIVTVPYNEEIQYFTCLHCGKVSPLYGHLHSFCDNSFPSLPGWWQTRSYIVDRGLDSGFVRRVYRTLFPFRAWMAVVYDKIR
jgi:ubiquinone/menaquinone biosynthesis C-methylase UbiE